MTEGEAIDQMIEHLNGLFPKTCANCGRCFPSLFDYIQNTEPRGYTIAHDLEVGEASPSSPIGTVAVANCRCGSSLALTSEGMPLVQLWSLLNWAKGEAQRRGQSEQELLTYLRGEIRQKVLAAGV
jgi:hypothetical protein